MPGRRLGHRLAAAPRRAEGHPGPRPHSEGAQRGAAARQGHKARSLKLEEREGPLSGVVHPTPNVSNHQSPRTPRAINTHELIIVFKKHRLFWGSCPPANVPRAFEGFKPVCCTCICNSSKPRQRMDIISNPILHEYTLKCRFYLQHTTCNPYQLIRSY